MIQSAVKLLPRPARVALHLCLLFLCGQTLFAASLAEEREAAHARSFLADGRAELAVSQCRQFRERFPTSVLLDQVLNVEGQSWRALKRPAEALGAWQALATAHAESPLAAMALLSVGDCHMELGRPTEAVKSWQGVAERFPDSAQALEGLLKAEAALAAPRATLALDPAGDAERLKARLDLLRRAMELDADSEGGLEACRRWAILLLAQGQIEEARFLLRRVTREAAPGALHLRALGHLVALELHQQRREEALGALQLALDDYEDSPLRSRLWLDLAQLRLELGLPEAAERGLALALQEADARVDGTQRLDSLQLLHADALSLCGRCAELGRDEGEAPRHPFLLARRAACLAVQGDSSRAAVAWAEVADSLGRSALVRAPEQDLLALALVELTRCQRATGLAAMAWEDVAALATRVPGPRPALTEVAEELLRQGLAREIAPLLDSRHDAPEVADRRSLVRLKQALALGRLDEARELVRIFRERWGASPLLAEVERLAPADMRPRPGTLELDLLQAEWAREDAPTPEDLRAHIERLEGLRREARGDEMRTAAALVEAWHLLRESMRKGGRDGAAQSDCARRALAWGDSLREADAATLMRLAAAHLHLKQGEEASLLWTRVLREQGEQAEALEAARCLLESARCDSTLRRELADHFLADWAWARDARSQLLRLARMERWQGDPARGLELTDRLLAGRTACPVPVLEDSTPEVLVESAFAHEALGRGDEARRRWLRAAVLARGDGGVKAGALLAAARSFVKAERTEEGRALALRVGEGSGDAAREAQRLLARLDGADGRHGDALARLDKLAPGTSSDLALRLQWVCALYRAGRADRGRPEFQRLLKEAPKGAADSIKAQVNLELGLATLAAGDLAQAEKSFQLVATDLAHTPQAATAQVGLARIFKAQGKADKALKALDVLERRGSTGPDGASAAALRAQWAEDAGDITGALRASWMQVERSGGKARHAALSALIERAARLSRPADEQQALMRYREDYPAADDRLARRLREAQLLINAGESAAARAQLRALQADAVGEEAAELQFRLAEAAEAAGDLPGAVLEFEKTAHVDPTGGLDWGASALFEAARGWQSLGRPAEAERALREVMRLEGTDSAHGHRATGELEALRAREEKP